MTPKSYISKIPIGTEHCHDQQKMEFHIHGDLRKKCDFDEALFSSTGNVIFANFSAVQLFAQKYNEQVDGKNHPEHYLSTGKLNAMGLLDEIFHYVCRLYRQNIQETFFSGAIQTLEDILGKKALDRILLLFVQEFPPKAVYKNNASAATWLAGKDTGGVSHRVIALEELVLLRLANENPAFEPFFPLFSDKALSKDPAFQGFWNAFRSWSAEQPPFGLENLDLISMLKAPVEYSPYDLKGQLEYIRTHWADILGEWLSRLLAGLDLIAEEEKAGWGGGPGPDGFDTPVYEFDDISKEYERFSPDKDWMPNVVMIAKSTLVWLDQLSKKYKRSITRLDQVPDEELDALQQAGFNGLWLIGVWERSPASARIKQINGNPEAAASAYSLNDYEISGDLGGWSGLENLRTRAWARGIRMASDMVPNHTGMDSDWVVNKPDYFIQTKDSPFSGYDFSGENLSHDDRVGIYLENNYYSKSDCAVVFKRVDHHTGDTRYIYHGNDGTGLPWNDTAQVDFLNPEAREEVIQKILHVASNFPIIRFDAAMVLAKKHIQRLWYPEPGKGGDIASRSRFAISREEFEQRIPEEFWREVVDRCAKEIPDTLLLAEAFWMMEGYFVRTLGMHRVYNSAFMNMLKREENEKYRSTIKNTIEFDPEILKRYVNFMNNPDEDTAVAQFGKGDKYFGVCTMMVAMPGLPMFGHGQIEGFEEKYGMEYRKSYYNEVPDQDLISRHHHEIFPLMKKRYLFAGVDNFYLYDFWENGNVNENVFAWSNRAGSERSLIFYNNVYQQTSGWIQQSAAYAQKADDGTKMLVQKNLAEGLGLTDRNNRFCVFKEQRSGLWFIRTVKEIVTNGFFAALDGFQTQVFVNIKEIDDNNEGHYRALYESLGGSGIQDIHMGIQNIVYKDLYSALTKLVSPETFKKIDEIMNSETKKMEEKKNQFFTHIHSPALDFFKEIALLPGFATPEPTKTKNSIKKSNSINTNKTAEAALIRYKLYLDRIFSLENDVAVFQTDFPHLSENTKSIPKLLAAAAILFAVRHVSSPIISGDVCNKLITQYDLGRKLGDLLVESKIGNKPHQFLIAMGDFLSQQKLFNEQAAQIPWTDFFNTNEIKQQMNVHPWEQVLWFSKEQSEEMLDMLHLSMIIFNDCDENANQQRNKKISSTIKKLGIAFENSEYQFENLIKALTQKGEKKPSVKSTIKGKIAKLKKPNHANKK